jgi:formylglycine-generating enzyme required for sulfatase activity
LERDIPGRLFGSLFVPRRVALEGRLEPDGPLESLRRAGEEYARWAFAGEPTAAWQIPQVLSGGAYRAGPAARDPAIRRAMDALLSGSLGYTVTKAALRDFLRARFLLDNGGRSPSPVSLIRSGRALIAAAASAPGVPAALTDILDAGAVSRITESAWYAASVAEAQALSAAPAVKTVPGGARPAALSGAFTLAGIDFVYIDGGELTRNAVFPRKTGLDGFWISRTEVSPASWERFIAANPAWNRSRRETLTSARLVNSGYLESYPAPATAGPTGVQGVSWHAAAAYCAWLTGELPPAAAGLEIRLPTETEWEYAARRAAEPGGPSLVSMLGGLWEWCAGYHIPLPIFPETAGEAEIPSPERDIRGGAWINPPGSVNLGARASLPADNCSPFVSFRPVIARKRNAP